MKKLKPKYSGKESVEFWNRVKTLDGREKDLVYIGGCALQDMERRILQLLEYAETK